MVEPKTRKKKIQVFAKIIRQNTGHDLVTCAKLSKLFLRNKINLLNEIPYPLATQWELVDVVNYHEEEVFTGFIHCKEHSELWKIPNNYYSWIF